MIRELLRAWLSPKAADVPAVEVAHVKRDGPKRGSKERPIVIRKEGPPVKYECRECRQWFVETAFDTMLRHDVYGQLCEPCLDRRQDAEWAKQTGEWDSEWDEVAR